MITLITLLLLSISALIIILIRRKMSTYIHIDKDSYMDSYDIFKAIRSKHPQEYKLIYKGTEVSEHSWIQRVEKGDIVPPCFEE